MMSSAPNPRQTLRASLLAQRAAFMTGAAANDAANQLAHHLAAILLDLEPDLLGLYWPHRSEFNAAAIVAADARLSKLAKALPYAQRTPVQMHYRTWDGTPPRSTDECGIPASDGPPARPDVVLVPCVGYTREGHRLGYGGGYFDRWLGAHPEVTSIGVAWSGSELAVDAIAPEPHDQLLTLVVTERGVV